MLNRRMLFASAAILPVTACAGFPADKLPPDVLAFISKVQGYVVKGCGFLPFVEGIWALIGGVVPVAATVEVVAEWICHAIPPSAGLVSRAGQRTVLMVHDKPVTGEFVR